MLVLPMTTAPAAFSRDTTSASSVGMQSLNCGKPQVVGSPTMLNGSLSVTGMPVSGRASPRAGVVASAASAALAARPRALEVAHDDGIEAGVRHLDPRDDVLEQLGRGYRA